VDARRVERRGVLVGHFARWLTAAGMKMNRSAADLILRDNYVAAVLLQHAGSGPVRLAKQYVTDATGEQRDAAASAPFRRQKLRQRRQRLFKPGQHGDEPAEPRRQQPPQPRADQQPIQSECLRDASRAKRLAKLFG